MTSPHDAIRAAAGDGWSDDPATIAPHLVDWRGRVRGAAAMIVWPRSTDAVAAIVRAAAAGRVPLVPQGGNTGLAGGATPSPAGDAVIVSTGRMTGIAAVDVAGLTVTVGAGAILADVQAAAAAAGLAFPLDLAAKGSATIGGLVSTNAGGVQVVRHGTMRAQIAGLEAVLPSGAVLDQLAPLVKDTAGYDIKQLLIGAEGTLGIVTRVCLRLVPGPRDRAVAWAGVASPDAALALLRRLRAEIGEVESFELIPAAGVDLVAAHGLRPPLAQAAPWQVLIELASPRAAGLTEALTAVLAAASPIDAVVAQSEAQAAALWRLRETLPEAERRDGVAVKHDIAVPVPALPGFVAATTPAVEAAFAGSRVLAFGHLGDGNLHYNVRAPAGHDSAAWVAANGAAVTRLVNDRVVAAGGTIAAEHGIGSVKAAELARLGDPARLAAMRAVKAALDPLGIMNPGKVLA
ncbi:MAG: FAD-binding oxidoreductase [Sphingomonadaceae bacterium]|nr:FAD-binding oxidoreductase [Sphingomonadaceae bacterium]